MNDVLMGLTHYTEDSGKTFAAFAQHFVHFITLRSMLHFVPAVKQTPQPTRDNIFKLELTKD